MYGDWYSGPENNGIFTQELEIPVPEVVQNNGSFYLHTFLVRSGDSPDPSGVNGPYRPDYTVHRTRKMNRLKKRKYGKTHNLLTGNTIATEEEILVKTNFYSVQILLAILMQIYVLIYGFRKPKLLRRKFYHIGIQI